MSVAWPQQDESDPNTGAAYFNNVKKYVASTTLTNPTWNNTEVLQGPARRGGEVGDGQVELAVAAGGQPEGRLRGDQRVGGVLLLRQAVRAFGQLPGLRVVADLHRQPRQPGQLGADLRPQAQLLGPAQPFPVQGGGTFVLAAHLGQPPPGWLARMIDEFLSEEP
ncbi:hypothetical protein [Micromonospora parastrephiae]|uniref:hypothetical protein n=1 Tax=Micromonospora parastrephiae TaxID=2806101 RepID=UPI001EE3E79B|nr:hypothetical protein [Micromonospora parastrephiae]